MDYGFATRYLSPFGWVPLCAVRLLLLGTLDGCSSSPCEGFKRPVGKVSLLWLSEGNIWGENSGIGIKLFCWSLSPWGTELLCCSSSSSSPLPFPPSSSLSSSSTSPSCLLSPSSASLSEMGWWHSGERGSCDSRINLRAQMHRPGHYN